MERRRLKPVRLFSSDLDGTLAGNRHAENRFADAWARLDPASRPLLVYNSGRLLADMRDFLPKTGLPPADVLIGGVGTMMATQGDNDHGREFATHLGPAFEPRKIKEILQKIANARLQPGIFQHAHKSSWYLHDASPDTIGAIERDLGRAGLNARVVYSSARDLDILPAGIDKGAALAWLCKKLKIGLDEVLVAGDTGNDASMFALPGVRGVIVANALPELSQLAEGSRDILLAQQPMADGVLQGLRHWGLLMPES